MKQKAGKPLSIEEMRAFLEMRETPGYRVFMDLLRVRKDTHLAMLRSPSLAPDRRTFECGGFDAIEAVEKLLAEDVENAYLKAVEQQESDPNAAEQRSPDARRPSDGDDEPGLE